MANSVAQLQCVNELMQAYAQARLALDAVSAEMAANPAVAKADEALKAAQAPFAERVEDAAASVKEAEAALKSAVLDYGVSYKGYGFYAVFTAGKVSWNADKLEGMAATHPAILTAKSIGAAGVAIRVFK